MKTFKPKPTSVAAPRLPSRAPASTGPKGALITGHLTAFGRDPLGFLERCARDYGDFVPLRFFNRRVWLVSDTDAIEAVLASNSRSFRKTIGYRTPFMRRLFGQGLLTSEGEFWTRQRRLAQPAFHRDRIAAYGGFVAEYTGRMLDSWRPGEIREIHGDMMRLTTRIVTKSLFNSDVPREIDDLGEASAIVMKRFSTQWRGLRLLAQFLPTPESRRFERVMRSLDDYILTLVRQRRCSGEDAGDLLSMLLRARAEDGSGMSDRQLRDELTTLMVAGLDTTALALSWSLHLLARHPEAQARLRAETAGVLGGRPPALSDLARLPFTNMVVKESMRLYPPAWILGREAREECEIGGRRVAAGESIIMSQWIKHRDPRHFERPEEFIPERWGEKAVENLPRCAYFPFGGGPRVCIGAAFATMEAVLALAAITNRFHFVPVAKKTPVPWPSITLQPQGGVWLRLES